MGNLFGHGPQNGINLYLHPEITPGPDEEPTFEPNFGFPKARKERVMIATKEEMISAKIPLQDRDFCAHLLLKFRACRAEMFPWVVKCKHEKHEYLNCRHEDYIIRAKEFERERRLRVREEKESKKCVLEEDEECR